MRVVVKEGRAEREKVDVLVIGFFQDKRGNNDVLGRVDKLLKGKIRLLLRNGDFKGELKEVFYLYSSVKSMPKYVFLVGLGKKDKLTQEKVRIAFGSLAEKMKEKKVRSISIGNVQNINGLSAGEVASAIVESINLSNYVFNEYKTKNKKVEIEKIIINAGSKRDISGLRKSVRKGLIISDSANFTRDIIIKPANLITPTKLSEIAKEMSKKMGLKCNVLSKKDIAKLGMNLLLAVGSGSSEPVKFIIVEYAPKVRDKKKLKTLVIVGKGITFDSGGLNLKPTEHINHMWYDMSGGATCLGIMRAVSQLNLGLRVIGLIPATENVVGGSAYKPGDIIKSYSGKTVEVVNTDAEGRLAMADALSYGLKYNPDAILDVATLTGAIYIALGKVAVGIFGNNRKMLDMMKEASHQTGEKGWEMPMWDEYRENNKSDVADVRNLGGRDASSITAAKFLEEFVDRKPWIHLDIAGTAWTVQKKDYVGKGATGVGVRLVVNFIERLVEEY